MEGMRMPEKVVLAYSGGLDTSIIIPWLKENYSYDVIARVAEVGQGDDLEAVVEKAYKTGASKVVVEDLREEFLAGYVFPALQAGAVYEHKYLLGTSLARPVIAKHQVEVALREGATAVAHGCTGKGNDQVRFELTYKALAPHLKVIAPWREWDIVSREDAIDYAAKHNVPISQTTTKIYSRDRNIWHISHEGGALEDPANAAPDDMWMLTRSPKEAPDKAAEVTIGFERGRPVSVNGKRGTGVQLLESLNRIGAEHGIGRIDLVENRFVGMKSRGCYETPGGTLILYAHHELEALTLDRNTLHYKQKLALDYAEMVYNGLWFTPLREALDAFFETTSQTTTGEVTLRLYKGNIEPVSRRSPYSLYSLNIASFTMGAEYDQKDAEGFINLIGLPIRVRAQAAQAAKQGK
jgi:argininosuccinate synthase